jgi:hypothetical protein
MTTVALKNNIQIRQHQAIHAHMRFTISAIGKLDLQTCLPHIADLKSLKNRIKLYGWSLNDLKEAVQRDTGLNKMVFPDNHVLKSLLRENQQVLERINHAITLAEKNADQKIMREELNVILVKINLAVNTICETIKLNMIKEDALAKSLKTSSNSSVVV